MFDEWNWWLPHWLDRLLPEVDFEKPLPKVEVNDLVIIPDDISAMGPSGSDLRMMVRTAARMKTLAPQTIIVTDPLAFSGCSKPSSRLAARRPGGPKRCPGVHPVTMWRGRLSVAVDALETEADAQRTPMERLGPVETTNVQLPTGDRLQIPTGAETLRLKSYLIMCRNSTKDYEEFADLVDSVETETAALVLSGMDRYYCGQNPKSRWVATQLVRRLADPQPSDEHDFVMSDPDAAAEWEKVRQRCLSVAVAMLEEAK